LKKPTRSFGAATRGNVRSELPFSKHDRPKLPDYVWLSIKSIWSIEFQIWIPLKIQN